MFPASKHAVINMINFAIPAPGWLRRYFGIGLTVSTTDNVLDGDDDIKVL